MNLSDQHSDVPSGDGESFESALQRLEALVSELESGDVPLERSLESFEEAQRLIKLCETKLQAAEQALRQLTRDPDPGREAPSSGE